MNAHFEAIADGLAEQGYAVVDQFLSQDELTEIRKSEKFHPRDSNISTKRGSEKNDRQINEAIRGDFIQWIDREQAQPSVKVYLDRIQEMIGYINQSLYLSLKDYEIHMTIYPVGSYYKRHLDQFKQDDHRKLSVICYLNDEWKDDHGGQLRMYLDNNQLDVLPVGGRLVCFRSDMIEHEVLPATPRATKFDGLDPGPVFRIASSLKIC